LNTFIIGLLSATFYFILSIASPFMSRIGDKNGKPLQMIALDCFHGLFLF